MNNRDKMPYLTFLAQSAVQDVARAAVHEYIKEMEGSIKSQVKEKLQSGEMVDALTKCILRLADRPYDVRVEFNNKEE